MLKCGHPEACIRKCGAGSYCLWCCEVNDLRKQCDGFADMLDADRKQGIPANSPPLPRWGVLLGS